MASRIAVWIILTSAASVSELSGNSNHFLNESSNVFLTKPPSKYLLLLLCSVLIGLLSFEFLARARLQGFFVQYLLRRYCASNQHANIEITLDSTSFSIIFATWHAHNLRIKNDRVVVTIKVLSISMTYWLIDRLKIGPFKEGGLLLVRAQGVQIRLSPAKKSAMLDNRMSHVPQYRFFNDDMSDSEDEQGFARRSSVIWRSCFRLFYPIANRIYSNVVSDIFCFLVTCISMVITDIKVSLTYPDSPIALSMSSNFLNGKLGFTATDASIKTSIRSFYTRVSIFGFDSYWVSWPNSVPKDLYSFVKSNHIDCQYIYDSSSNALNSDCPMWWSTDHPLEPWILNIQYNDELFVQYSPISNRLRSLLYYEYFPMKYEDQVVSNDYATVPSALRGCRIDIGASNKTDPCCRHFKFIMWWAHTASSTESLTVTSKSGFSFSAYVPYLVGPDGSDLSLNVLFHDTNVSASSLCFSRLYSPRNGAKKHETMITANIHFPNAWHDVQVWRISFHSKSPSIVYLLNYHIDYVKSFVDDWTAQPSSPVISNASTFIRTQYLANFQFDLIQIRLPVNQFNVLDCNEKDDDDDIQNTYFIIESNKPLLINLSMPFLDFCPELATIEFDLTANELVLSFLFGLDSLNTSAFYTLLNQSSNFQSHISRPNIIKAWYSPELSVKSKYTYHPVDSFLTFSRSSQSSAGVDPFKLSPDMLENSIFLGSFSDLLLSGSLLRYLWFFKDNYFGLYQNVHDIRGRKHHFTQVAPDEPFHQILLKRPLLIKLHMIITRIRAHIGAYDNGISFAPIILVDGLHTEVFYNHETMRLGVGFTSVRSYIRGERDMGSLYITDGIQFRAQSLMCPQFHKPESIEYAWIVEVIIGKLEGRILFEDLDRLVRETLPSFILTANENERNACIPFEIPKQLQLKVDQVKLAMDGLQINVTSPKNLQLICTSMDAMHLIYCSLHHKMCRSGAEVVLMGINCRHLMNAFAPNSTFFETAHLICPLISVNFRGGEGDVSRTSIQFLVENDRKFKRIKPIWEQRMSTEMVTCVCFGGIEFCGKLPPDFFGKRNCKYAANECEFGFVPNTADRLAGLALKLTNTFVNPSSVTGNQSSIPFIKHSEDNVVLMHAASTGSLDSLSAFRDRLRRYESIPEDSRLNESAKISVGTPTQKKGNVVVDLAGQMNIPIWKSRLLLDSYVEHSHLFRVTKRVLRFPTADSADIDFEWKPTFLMTEPTSPDFTDLEYTIQDDDMAKFDEISCPMLNVVFHRKLDILMSPIFVESIADLRAETEILVGAYLDLVTSSVISKLPSKVRQMSNSQVTVSISRCSVKSKQCGLSERTVHLNDLEVSSDVICASEIGLTLKGIKLCVLKSCTHPEQSDDIAVKFSLKQSSLFLTRSSKVFSEPEKLSITALPKPHTNSIHCRPERCSDPIMTCCQIRDVLVSAIYPQSTRCALSKATFNVEINSILIELPDPPAFVLKMRNPTNSRYHWHFLNTLPPTLNAWTSCSARVQGTLRRHKKEVEITPVVLITYSLYKILNDTDDSTYIPSRIPLTPDSLILRSNDSVAVLHDIRRFLLTSHSGFYRIYQLVNYMALREDSETAMHLLTAYLLRMWFIRNSSKRSGSRSHEALTDSKSAFQRKMNLLLELPSQWMSSIRGHRIFTSRLSVNNRHRSSNTCRIVAPPVAVVGPVEDAIAIERLSKSEATRTSLKTFRILLETLGIDSSKLNGPLNDGLSGLNSPLMSTCATTSTEPCIHTYDDASISSSCSSQHPGCKASNTTAGRRRNRRSATLHVFHSLLAATAKTRYHHVHLRLGNIQIIVVRPENCKCVHESDKCGLVAVSLTNISMNAILSRFKSSTMSTNLTINSGLGLDNAVIVANIPLARLAIQIHNTILHAFKSSSLPPETLSSLTRRRLFDASLETEFRLFESFINDVVVHPTSIRERSVSSISGVRLQFNVFVWMSVHQFKFSTHIGDLRVNCAIDSLRSSLTLKRTVMSTGIFENTQNPRAGSSLPYTMQQTCHSSPYTGSLCLVLRSTSLCMRDIRDFDLPVLSFFIAETRVFSSANCEEQRLWNENGQRVAVSALADLVTVDVPLVILDIHRLVTKHTERIATSMMEYFVPIPKTNEEVIPDSAMGATTPSSTTSHLTHQTTSLTWMSMGTVSFNVQLQGLRLADSLHSNLKAEYKVGLIEGNGIVSKVIGTDFYVNEHALKFLYKLGEPESETTISFPPCKLHVKREDNIIATDLLDLVLEIERLRHTMSVDVLAELLFVLRLFWKSVSKIFKKIDVQKLISKFAGETTSLQQQLSHRQDVKYRCGINMQGVEITCRTSTYTAVRLESGTVPIKILITNWSDGHYVPNKHIVNASFGILMGLGQLIYSAASCANPLFQQSAYFRTCVQLQNKQIAPDKDVIYIDVTRPLFYLQPGGLDCAILFYVSYRNSYDYCLEQRASTLDGTSNLITTSEMVDAEKCQSPILATRIGSQKSSRLSQLTISLNIVNLGIAFRLFQKPLVQIGDLDAANTVVFTLDRTSISGAVFGKLVLAGSFAGFCLRFADNFVATYDNWRGGIGSYGSANDVSIDLQLMNSWRVPFGSYEIYSRTERGEITHHPFWNLIISWKMKGIAIDLDPSIGYNLALLGNALAHTGFARCDENDDECSDVDFDSVQETYSACCQTVFAKNCRDSVSNKSKEEFRGIIRNLEKKIEQLRKSGGTQDEIDTNLRQLRLFEERLMGNFIKGLHDLFKSKQILNVVDGGELDKFGIGSRARSHTKNAQQPPAAVNFQLQLQLHIESGLAILHPDIFCEKLEDTGATLSQQKKRMRDEQERSEFELPGILVNAKYSSVYPETFDLCGHGEFFQGRYANLYCQCFVQSMSNCMMLNPQVLDFFDRMIEGMRKPDDRKPQTTTSASVLSVEDPKTPPFFMNVVVSVAIEPSIILLTCHPHSRMECELRSPSIDFVFTRTAPVEQKQLLRFKRKGESAGLASNSIFHCSVRAKDFRVKIYHPYVSTRIPSVGVSHDRSDGNTASSRIKAGALSRSALVLSVSSALCNIGRFRNVSYSGSCIEQDVHVAAVFRIGKSSFDYDVRKLQEILCFPRAWYNKSLMRKLFIGDEGRRESKNITPNTTSGANNCWCTRVSFTGCIEQVHINMKMSNIMGIVSWLTQQLHTIGSIRLDSYHNREIDIETYFESSRFVAEQGIIGGKSEIVDMWVRFLTNEKRPRVADYALKANLGGFELRLDHMTECIMLCRIVQIELNILNAMTTEQGVYKCELDLNFNNAEAMINASTGPDLMRMFDKLREFCKQQLQSSRSILYMLKPETSSSSVKSTSLRKKNLPKIKNRLGICDKGNLKVKTTHGSLAVFHGMNFKARQWAVFSTTNATLEFEVSREGPNELVQRLNLNLGNVETMGRSALIYRVIKGALTPSQSSDIRDWFDYALQSALNPSSMHSYDQTTEPIFVVPQSQFNLIHRVIDNNRVICNFRSTFATHALFTFNADHYMFLHDLIIRYMSEKSIARCSLRSADSKRQSEKSQSQTSTMSLLTPIDSISMSELSDDIRVYECPSGHWKLEPNIRLIAPYGSEVEPVGADKLLAKLGFKHARITIPKWIQRSIMDSSYAVITTITDSVILLLLPEWMTRE